LQFLQGVFRNFFQLKDIIRLKNIYKINSRIIRTIKLYYITLNIQKNELITFDYIF